ncbi:hypothetical protein ABZW30_08710 [Kitasatospora sp. NPDC004669]|uniref:hypothetical protein n=1 Tax=Kitasatospora sp. NPDC004669 TaxID=3154555 RepID=UPI0033A473ED
MTTVLKKYATQREAEEDLKKYVDRDRWSSLTAALNDAYDRKGKDSGNHPIDGETVNVRHSSAGVVGTTRTATLFHFFRGNEFCLVALGQHEGNGYRIDDELGQATSPFQKKKLVGPSGN